MLNDLALTVIELYAANRNAKIVSDIKRYENIKSWGATIHYNDRDAYQTVLVTDEYISNNVYIIEE